MASKKYDTSGAGDLQFQPGSRELVLKNLMCIKIKREMDKVESVALKQAEDYFLGQYDAIHKFMAKDICDMHKVWLGRIYTWAGTYRQVDLTKGKVRFAHAKYLDSLMGDFEKDFLRKYTPCNFKDDKSLIDALAKVHVEFVMIHPFREGNGRIARLLTTLMALQAGKPLLNYSSIHFGKGKQEYFKAIQAGWDREYDPMKKVITSIFKKTLSGQAVK